jgi:WhiB family redox-sensing transcriptional regulator
MTSHLLRPPGPQAASWNWQLHAACRGMDVNLFFSPLGERGHARERREREARRICSRCPVRRTCAEFAEEAGEPYGVWGGLSETERRAAA